MDGHLQHIQVYSPGRKHYSKLTYLRSQSVDDPRPSERELLNRIKKAVAASPMARAKPRKAAPRKAKFERPQKPFLQSARHSSLLVEFAVKDYTPTYQPIQLHSRKRKSPNICLPLI